MVSIRPPVSSSFSPLFKILGSVPSAPLTIGITVTIMFHSVLSSLTRSKYLSLFSVFLNFHSMLRWDGKIHYTAGSLFLLRIITRFRFLTRIRWSVCLLKSLRILWMDFSSWVIYLVISPDFNFLYNSQWITLLTLSYLVLYSLFTSFLFCCILSIFVLK